MTDDRDREVIIDALSAIDPARLSYQEWLDVGLALHESGLTCRDWDQWSRRDAGRYHEGECFRKWAGFGNGMGDHVRAGTIIDMAKRAGWSSPSFVTGEAFGWDDLVALGPDPAWVDSEEPTTTGRSATGQLYDYISELFDDDDFVGYVTESYEADGRSVPTKGHYTRTAGELRHELSRTSDLGAVVGDWKPEVGAWIRFNPLDGRGVGNANVTEYRFALIESDTLPLDRQLPMIRAMNLPCAAIVTSGRKSVHAIVRIDAGRDYDLYRKRVERLHAYCRQHGFEPDGQNKNPSRLSRMPGATRDGQQQSLVALREGAESWDAWETWVAEMEDDLPEEVSGDWDAPISLRPPLIGMGDADCILRQSQKMIVVGDSKMGKSYTLIDLTEAICTGGDWLGMRCAKGRVFYVNLEIDDEEFRDRQHKVWDDRAAHGQRGTPSDIDENFVKWNLRGHATVLSDLAPKLIRRMLKYGPPGTFAAVIIDPIYKVNGGDDNDAKAVAKFTNTLDLIVDRCGCAAIYAHHHPKGTSGQKKSMDRMSGSGVYARDADTVLDFTLLDADDQTRARFSGASLFRVTVTCRSFGSRPDMDVAFKFPRFYEDRSGLLSKLRVEGEEMDPAQKRKLRDERRDERHASDQAEKVRLVGEAVAECRADGVLPTRQNVLERIGEYHDEAVTRGQLNGWTNPSRSQWTPFSVVRDANGTDVIVDAREDK